MILHRSSFGWDLSQFSTRPIGAILLRKLEKDKHNSTNTLMWCFIDPNMSTPWLPLITKILVPGHRQSLLIKRNYKSHEMSSRSKLMWIRLLEKFSNDWAHIEPSTIACLYSVGPLPSCFPTHFKAYKRKALPSPTEGGFQKANLNHLQFR